MTPLERRAAMKAAVTLRQITMNQAARELGVSYNHLTLVLLGNRQGSVRLEQAIAKFLGRSRDEVFPRP
jgi:transcriptional regulator with XRE-family HTH domain